MKTKTLFIAIFIIVFQIFIAQKKGVAKTAKSPATNTSLLYKLLGADANEALVQLDDVFSAKGISSNKVTDKTCYAFDENYRKTDAVSGYEKTIYFTKNDKSLITFLKTDESRKILSIEVYFTDSDLENEMKQILEIEKWPAVEKKGTVNIYKEKNKVAISKPNSLMAFSDGNYNRIAERNKKSGVVQLPNYLSKTDGFADYYYQTVMPLVGSSLIAVSDHITPDRNGDLYLKTETHYYKNGFIIDIFEFKSYTLTTIQNSSKIALNNLLSKLQDTGFKEKYQESVTGDLYFQNTKDAMLKQTENSLVIYALPDNSEGGQNTTYQGQQPISPSVLSSIRDNFSDKQKRNEYLKDHFHSIMDEKGVIRFFGLDDEGKKIRCYIADDDTFTKNWGQKFDISFSTQNMMEHMNEYLNDNLVVNTKSLSEDFYKHNAVYYDKTMYLASKTSYEMQENANLLAQQKAEAQRKEQEIAENERKAKRNAELNQGLQLLTNELLKLQRQ